jgi:putative heme iron utilization protein
MSKILKSLGQALLRPIIKLRATARRNAIIYANMSPEQLREHKRVLDELRAMREQRSELLLRHRPPGLF